MAIRAAVREVRRSISDYLGKVHYSGETVIVERYGKPMVAMIPVALYERMIEEREARFETIERIRARMPDLPPEEVEQDVLAAIEAIRAAEQPE